VHGRRLPNRTCDHCGEEFRSRYKKEDHIVPVRAFVETPVTAEPDAHYPDNLVCLCPSCHRNAEFGNVVPACLRAATPSAAAF
jgi:5-methylcytosine-specific restriction endonuclease McrA